jgi:hypothetical protein
MINTNFNTKPVIPRFPFIGIKDKLVVLFEEEKKGTVLYCFDGGFYHIGEYRTDWIMDLFEPYYGEFIINNIFS